MVILRPRTHHSVQAGEALCGNRLQRIVRMGTQKPFCLIFIFSFQNGAGRVQKGAAVLDTGGCRIQNLPLKGEQTLGLCLRSPADLRMLSDNTGTAAGYIGDDNIEGRTKLPVQNRSVLFAAGNRKLHSLKIVPAALESFGIDITRGDAFGAFQN